jgi:hypothetical protein
MKEGACVCHVQVATWAADGSGEPLPAVCLGVTPSPVSACRFTFLACVSLPPVLPPPCLRTCLDRCRAPLHEARQCHHASLSLVTKCFFLPFLFYRAQLQESRRQAAAAAAAAADEAAALRGALSSISQQVGRWAVSGLLSCSLMLTCGLLTVCVRLPCVAVCVVPTRPGGAACNTRHGAKCGAGGCARGAVTGTWRVRTCGLEACRTQARMFWLPAMQCLASNTETP